MVWPCMPRALWWEHLLEPGLRVQAEKHGLTPQVFVLSEATVAQLDRSVDGAIYGEINKTWLAALADGDDARVPVRL